MSKIRMEIGFLGWRKKDTGKSTVNFQCMVWMHRMRTLRADFVDAAVDGPSEIKLPPGWKHPPGGACTWRLRPKSRRCPEWRIAARTLMRLWR
ncbi:hypothetical protein ABL841_20560 [Variovorax paradoxus]|uniref:hypothetical protein n=1 Tax=Variovorax paradoxus TaxID=34073 RepID=UPI0012BD6804|nr:hypothetical protein [Variovorax paradoxus]